MTICTLYNFVPKQPSLQITNSYLIVRDGLIIDLSSLLDMEIIATQNVDITATTLAHSAGRFCPASLLSLKNDI